MVVADITVSLVALAQIGGLLCVTGAAGLVLYAASKK